MSPASDDRSQAVLGGFDGITSAVGVVAGGVVGGVAAHSIVVVGSGLAAAAAVSMAGGQWLATGSQRKSAILGGAAGLGSLVPCLPFLIRGSAGVGASLALTALAALVVAILRPESALPSVVRTAVVLLVASALSVAVALGMGAV